MNVGLISETVGFLANPSRITGKPFSREMMKHPDVQARGVARGMAWGALAPLEVLRKIRNETNSARNKEKI